MMRNLYEDKRVKHAENLKSNWFIIVEFHKEHFFSNMKFNQ